MESPSVHSWLTQIRTFGLLLVIALFICLASCGHKRASPTTASVKPATTGSVHKTVSLAGILAEIDAYPVPKNVDRALFEKLRAKLKELVTARSDGKTISKVPVGTINAIDDLTAVENAGDTATITWTEKIAGDTSNDGTVDIADLQPIAAHFGERPSGPGSPGYLADANGDGEVSITDLQPIADHYSEHIAGYELMRGQMVNGAIDWELTIRPNLDNPSSPYSKDRTTLPPANARASYTYGPDPIAGLDHNNTWYEIRTNDGGGGGTPHVSLWSDPAKMTPVYTVSGTVIDSNTQLGLEDATMTLTRLSASGKVLSSVSVQTQSDGTYVFTGVVPADYELNSAKQGYSFPDKSTFSVVDADYQVPEIVATPGLWSISGVCENVYDASEKIQGVVIELYLVALSQTVQQKTTGPDGAFAFSNVAAGRYIVKVHKNGYGFTAVAFDINVETYIGAGCANLLFEAYASVQESPLVGPKVPWPKFHNDKQNNGVSVFQGAASNALKWVSPLGGAVNSSPAVGVYTYYRQAMGGWVEHNDPRLYIGCDTAGVYALNPADGSVVWQYAQAGSVRATPTIGANSVVYVGSEGGTFYALDPTNGNPRWTWQLGSPFVASATLDENGILYVPTCAQTGNFLQRMKPMYSGFQGDGNTSLGGPAHSSPALDRTDASDPKCVYVGADCYLVYCINKNSTSVEHLLGTPYPNVSSPVVGSDRTIFVASASSTSGGVRAFDPTTEAIKWTSGDLGPIHSSPALGTDGTLYVGSDNGYVYAINSADGTTKWSHLTGGSVSSSPAVCGTQALYVGSSDMKLYALNPADGSVLWSYTTGGAIISSPAIDSDGTVYVGSADHNVYAFGPGSGSPTWSVTGRVTLGGVGLQGVPLQVQPLGFSTNTLSDGTYEINRLPNGSYTVTPAWRGFTFTPPNRQITISGATVTGQDFTATRDPWMKFHSDKFNSGVSPYQGPTISRSLKWQNNLLGQVQSSPTIDKYGNIYVGCNYGYVAAFGPDGALKWTYMTGAAVQSSPAIGSDGTVYVGSNDHKMYALNANLTYKWSYQTGAAVYSSPVIGDDGTIYFGSEDSNVYALHPGGTLSWQLALDSPIWTSPALSSDGATLYIGTNGTPPLPGSMYAISTVTHLVAHMFRPIAGLSGNPIRSSPAVGADGTIYFGCDNGYIYALDGVTLGFIYWQSTVRAIRSTPAVVSLLTDPLDEKIVVGCEDGYVYCFSSHLQTRLWRFPQQLGATVDSSPAVGSDGTVYVGAFGAPNSGVYALNWSDGSVRWSYQTNGQVTSSPAIGADPAFPNDGIIYVGSMPSSGGYLYAIKN